MTNTKEIIRVLELLKKYQKGSRKTTLNRESRDSGRYSPYQTLISCLLSLRAKDEVTEVISENLFKVAKTPEEMLNLSQKRLEKIIYSSGYYKNKAKAIKKTSEQIIKEYNGKVPNTKEELLELYGVGPKTANIVLAFSFNKPVIPVDVHVNRIPNRIGWIKTKTPEQSEIALMEIIPKKYWADFNGIFVLFGKTICVPVSPFCSKCLINKFCKRIGVKTSR